MIIMSCIALSVFFITYFRPVHGIGFFALFLIIHGILCKWFGPSAQHFPLYCGGAVFLGVLLRNGLKINMSDHTIVLIVLLCIMNISAFLNHDYELSLNVLLLYAKGFLLAMFVTMTIENEEQIRLLSIFLLIGVSIGSVNMLYEYFTGMSGNSVPEIQRSISLRGDPNETAMLLLVGIPLSLYWIHHSELFVCRFVNCIVFISIIGAIILTKSRGGFLGLICVLAILYFKNLSWKTTLGALSIVFFLAVFGFATDYWSRINTLKTGEFQGQSLESRTDFVKKGLVIFYENMLTGVGPGEFGKKYMQMKSGNFMISNSKKGPVAHNLYLEFAVENGIIGIILLLLIFYYSLRGFFMFSICRDNNQTIGILSYLGFSLIALLITGLFLSQGKNSVLWFIVGLGLTADQIRKQLTDPI